MKHIAQDCSRPKKQEQPDKQPSPFVLALMLTGFLYITVGPTLKAPKTVISQDTPINENLSKSVVTAVLEDVSKQSGVSANKLRIVKAERTNWLANCQGLSNSTGLCTPNAIEPGWQVIVAKGEKRWVYQTNASGTLVKLKKNQPEPTWREWIW